MAPRRNDRTPPAQAHLALHVGDRLATRSIERRRLRHAARVRTDDREEADRAHQARHESLLERERRGALYAQALAAAGDTDGGFDEAVSAARQTAFEDRTLLLDQADRERRLASRQAAVTHTHPR